MSLYGKTILLGAANPHNAFMMRAIDYFRGPGCNYDDWCGFLDDTKTGEFCGLPILGGMDQIHRLVGEGYRFVNTISGTTVGRYEVSKKVIDAGGEFVDFIYPDNSLADFKHGTGIYIQDQVGIQEGVTIGDNVAIHARAFISHEVRIGHSCFVGAGVLAGRVVMGDGAYLAINTTVLPDVRIGKWATIGAGAVVLKDVPDYAVMVGNPARQIKENPHTYDSGAIR